MKASGGSTSAIFTVRFWLWGNTRPVRLGEDGFPPLRLEEANTAIDDVEHCRVMKAVIKRRNRGSLLNKEEPDRDGRALFQRRRFFSMRMLKKVVFSASLALRRRRSPSGQPAASFCSRAAISF
jgi:hypothetical protein